MYGISPKLPLIVDTLDGHYGLTKTLHEAIKQNFKHLILTAPGEKIMDSNFGVGVRNYLFENFTPDVEAEIYGNIFSQTDKYMSFLEITDVSITQAAENFNTLFLEITYQIPELGVLDTLVLTVSN